MYLCEVTPKVKKKTKSALNHTGGKYRLLDQILPLFPEDIDCFYDIFAGGCNVGLNVNAKHVHFNDMDQRVIWLYEELKKIPIADLLRRIEALIGAYNLSNTKKYGYAFYKADSSKGLKTVNQKQYMKLRDDFNNGRFQEEDNPVVAYVLLTYAFNNQVRFNSRGEYNMPVGKRDFNASMETKLIAFHRKISSANMTFSSRDFRDFKRTDFSHGDFIYADPPYLPSTATYSENDGWNIQDEKDLFDFLDSLHAKNIQFALSNVLVHKGKENILLKEWAEKYTIHRLDYSYTNANYQRKNTGKSIEVLITNY